MIESDGATLMMANEELPILPTRHQLFKLGDATVAEAKRFARNVAIALAIPGAITAIFVLLAKSRDLDDNSTRLGMACVVLFFGGVLPALAARLLVMRDVDAVPALVLEGDIYPARVVRRDMRSFVGGTSHIVISWHDSQIEHTAHFDARRLEDTLEPGTAVVTRGSRGPVGVVVNGKLFLARQR